MYSVNQPPAMGMRESLDTLIQSVRSTARSKNGMSAVFIDRDGTLNVEKGYILKAEDVDLLATASAAIRLLNQREIPVIIVTNQSAFARGLIDFAGFEKVNNAIWHKLQAHQAHYDALYYCPHVSGCECRKPQPGMLLQAAVDLNLDLHRSYMIGDKLIDIQAGHHAGCRTILVKTGWGVKTIQQIITGEIRPDHIAESVLDAVEWILSQA